MNKTMITLLAAGAAMALQAQTPNFDMIGFATLDGGTTGGAGGEIVYPTTFAQLKQYAEDPTTPYIIMIDREINTGLTAYVDTTSGHLSTQGATNAVETTYGEILSLGSNKTIMGVDDKGFLNRIGINIQCQQNIIIRNLRISLQDVPVDKSGENKIVALRGGVETLIGDPDCISIQADKESYSEAQRVSQHIWIDHCELYNYPKDSEHKDRYDGLIDAKNNTKNVTISWCHFHDHSKACLSGKGSSDNYDRTCTWHHNYFENIKGSRLPLLRFGRHHYYNNYIYGCEDGLNVRIQSNAYVENCYFEDTKTPVFGKKSEDGRATLVGNIFEGCSKLPPGCTNVDGAKQETLKADLQFDATDFDPNDYYDYSACLHSAEEARTIVPQYAGVGKIDATSALSTVKQADTAKAYATNGRIAVEAPAGSRVKIVNTNGMTVKEYAVGDYRLISHKMNRDIYIVNITNAKGEKISTLKVKI